MAPLHLMWTLTRQTILRLSGRTLTASRTSPLRNVPSCCRMTGCRTSRSKRPTRNFASSAHLGATNVGHPPNSFCSISSNSSSSSLDVSVSSSLHSAGAVCLGTGSGGITSRWNQPMWLVARSLLPLWLPLRMATCMQMTPQTPLMPRLPQLTRALAIRNRQTKSSQSHLLTWLRFLRILLA